MTPAMKAIGAPSRGDLSALEVVEVPEPEAGPGEVRVRVHASALNAADIKVVRGDFVGRFLHARVSPQIPGYDLSGVVDQVGSGVSDLEEGDAVFGHLAYAGKTRQGTFAERITIDATAVARVPDGVDHATAAAAATAGLTALQAMRDHAAVTEGSRVLILGAAGGVGSVAVGVAARLGAHVTGVCSTYAVEFVEGLGAGVVVDRKIADPLDHEQPFDAIFDSTGLYAYGRCARLLTASGAFVTTLPSLSFVAGKLRSALSRRRCGVVVVESRRADLEQLASWIAGGLTIPIAERFAARDAAAAMARMDRGRLLGKIAIDIDGGF